VGSVAIRWASIRSLYDPDAEIHRARARGIGLDAPSDVFEQLFHEPHSDPLFAAVVGSIDWAGVGWRETELSGSALAEVHVPRQYERAVEEARAAVVAAGLEDERPEVINHWHEYASWLRAPLLVSGGVVGRSLAYELLVGFARLGNLLGLMDRGDVPAATRHRVWVGEK
jgi:hypothetical protein